MAFKIKPADMKSAHLAIYVLVRSNMWRPGNMIWQFYMHLENLKWYSYSRTIQETVPPQRILHISDAAWK